MKTIGLIGGMSWESSIEYYRIINEAVKTRLGGLHSAQSLMYSVDFAAIEAMQEDGDWDSAADVLVDAAKRLEAGGADCIVLCTNTMHIVAEAIEQCVKLPFIHIADTTAKKILASGISKIALMATAYTMEGEFYRGRLEQKFALEVLIPPVADRQIVHEVIYDELCLGVIKDESREQYRRIIHDLVERGAEGVILGCTEITLLIKQSDSPVPTFDTTELHALASVDFALSD